eukprot:2110428-Karenia_brevis.AAC.1
MLAPLRFVFCFWAKIFKTSQWCSIRGFSLKRHCVGRVWATWALGDISSQIKSCLKLEKLADLEKNAS